MGIVKFEGKDYEVGDEQVLVIKVAKPKARRASTRPLVDFGKVFVKGKKDFLTDAKKKRNGHWGIMTVEDYQNKNFAPYGLSEAVKQMDAVSLAVSLKKENSSLQDESLQKDSTIADLQAKIAELEASKKGPVEEKKPKAETKKETEKTDK